MLTARRFTRTAVTARRPWTALAATACRNQSTQAGVAASTQNAAAKPGAATSSAPAMKPVSALHAAKVPTEDTSFIGMSGGQIFHEMMLRHGVKHIFGYPGGAILPVFDAIHQSKHFEFILPRHEQGAGHMAEGYARAR
jgi:acetolactate synthase-1/2/3 large subunit